jgi:YegS/Rv2252/BmrU family lipid kinase
MPTRALVVINPISGPSRRRSVETSARLARDVLGSHGVRVDVCVTRGPGDAREAATRARDGGYDLVLAWGGDGTINEVAGALAFSPVPLGIVPGGSGNGLARELGIPLDAAAALEAVASGRVRRIDAGRLGGSLFFNVAGVGLDALIADRIASPGAARGLLGYARLTLAELPRYEPRVYTVEIGDRRLESRALFIAVANSRQYGSGAQIAPGARLDDGRLDLVVVDAQPLRCILRRIPDLFSGRLREGRGVRMASITSATIHGEAPLTFHVDGEPRAGDRSLTATVHPGALLVRMPPRY